MPQALLLDINGVLYEDDLPLPGAVQALQSLRARGIPFRLVTNASRRTRAATHAKLASIGFDVQLEQVFSAPQAVLRHLRKHQLRPYCLIHSALEEEFGMPLDDPAANAVVIGDAEARFDYAHLNRAFQLLIQGMPLICMGANRYFSAGGALHLDAGPFVRALEYAADTEALVMGKPAPSFFRAALEDLGVEPEQALMIGDDVEADILGAQEVGLQACLVRTGKYRPGDEQRAPGAGLVADLAEAVARYC